MLSNFTKEEKKITVLPRTKMGVYAQKLSNTAKEEKMGV